MIKAVIVAGGRGKRLRPLTDSLPKPLIKIGGYSLLFRNIRLLTKYGITEFLITTNYLSDKIEEHLVHNLNRKIKYRIIKEKNPRGTAGSLGYLKKYLDNTFLVCYADIIREVDISRLIKFHTRKRGMGTVCVYRNSKMNPKSLVNFNKDNIITSFQERPVTANLPRTVWSSASLYVFEPEIINYVKKNKAEDFGKDVFPRVVKDGKTLYAFKERGYFLDVGDPEKLKQARNDFGKSKFAV